MRSPSPTIGALDQGPSRATELITALAALPANHPTRPLLRDQAIQAEIAEQIGVSQMHISRIIARALATLREDLGPDAR